MSRKSGNSSQKGTIIKEQLLKFPKTSSKSITRKIYNENSVIFENLEQVYGLVRYYRGQAGDKLRKDLKTPIAKLPSLELPESVDEDFEPYEIKSKRTLILSDIHIPYQDNKAVQLALEYGKSKDIDCILLNGDLMDFYGASRFDKHPTAPKIKDEFNKTRQFFEYLRSMFPDAKMVWKLGNHEERWEKYLIAKAPELFDVEEFQLEIILQLAKFKIVMVKDKLPIKLGKLTVLHGHEMAGAAGGVNPSRSTFLKTIDNVLVGHYHRTSQHTEPTLSGHVYAVNSQGCLCGLTPAYMRINKWNLGFSYCELDIKSGDYVLHNLKIIKGKIF